MMLSSIVTLSPNSPQLLCLISALFAWHVQENKSQDETKELVQLMAGKECGPQMGAIAVFDHNYTSRPTADTKKCVAKRKGEKMIEME